MVQNKKRIISVILMLTLLVSSLVIGAITASAAEETAALSFANKAQRTSFSSTKQVWEQNGITFTNDKSSSTNNVADYANPVRLYANSKVTIESSLGKITKIVFDCNSTSYATALKNSIGTVSGATVSVSSDKITVKFTTAVESFTVAKLTAQVRLDSLTVTYEATSTEPDVPACDHNWQDATCTAPRTCTKCGSTDGDALGHNLVTVDGKDATCTEDGYTEYQDCSRCDYIEGKKTIPASHNYVNGVCSCGEKQPLEATIDFSTTDQRTELTTSIQVWEKDGLSLTNNKGESTSNVADYSNPARFYKNSEIVISFPRMTQLVIDCSNTGDAKYSTPWGDMLTAAGLTYTVENKVYTITFAEPTDSITLSCSAQVRANSITATAKKICKHENVGDDYICDNEDCKEIIAPEDGSTLTIEQAIKLGEAFKDRTDVTHTTNTYLVVGTIIDENPTGTYGNCTIKSGDYAIYIRFLKNSDGADYGTVDVKPVLGDTITVIAQIGYYNRPELYKARWIKIDAHNHAYDNGCDIECNVCGDKSREPNHTYDNACDATCNVCNAEREVADHVYDSASNVEFSAATCTAPQYMKGKCSCGAISDADADKKAVANSQLDHSYDETSNVEFSAATCTAPQYMKGQCSCGAVSDADVDKKAVANSQLSHSFTNYMPNNDATCTADGTKTGTCSCGAKDTVADEGSKLDHTYTNYTSNGDATCTADGTKTGTCSCGAKDTVADEGSKLSHDACNHVAVIGDIAYESLQAAVNAAVNGDEIVLVKNVALKNYLNIWQENQEERSITLNLNGKTISETEDYDYEWYPLVFVGVNQNVTITGNGKITAKNNVTIGVYGTLDIVNGTFENFGTTDKDAVLCVWFWDPTDPDNKGYDDYVGGNCAIEGGKFVGEIVCDESTVDDVTTSLEIDGGNFSEATLVINSLEQAIKCGLATKNDSTIVLNHDITIDGALTILSGETLDLNGQTLTTNATIIFNGQIKGAGFLVVDKSAEGESQFSIFNGATLNEVPVRYAETETTETYIFRAATVKEATVNPEGQNFDYFFRPNLSGGGITNKVLFCGTAIKGEDDKFILNNRLELKLRVTRTNIETGIADEPALVNISDDVVYQVFSSSTSGFAVTLSGENAAYTYSVEFVIVSCGVEAYSAPLALLPKTNEENQ